ncbi:hypothetical protein NC652_034173 [Populus alba x Populus x berolinensis]|nr:hypothetical protein NC652_034173 [Populus alba x Populus x berolinensis]
MKRENNVQAFYYSIYPLYPFLSINRGYWWSIIGHPFTFLPPSRSLSLSLTSSKPLYTFPFKETFFLLLLSSYYLLIKYFLFICSARKKNHREKKTRFLFINFFKKLKNQ